MTAATTTATAPAAPRQNQQNRQNRQKGTARGALPLALSAVLVGMGNYGLSLFLVHRLPAPDFTVYAALSSVLLSVGTLAGATVPWVLAREVADSAPGSARRRLSVRTCLWLALGLSVLTAGAACGAVASYAGPGPLAGLAAACLMLWLNSVGAGYLQGRERFAGLAALRVAEVAVRVAVTVGAVAAGWGSAGAVGAFAAGAAVTSAAGFVALRGDMGRPVAVDGDEPVRADHGLWRHATAIGGIQVLTCVLFTLDVVVATAVRGGSAGLAPYQALLVLARVPLFLSTALATVVFPRLAAGPSPAARDGFRGALRLHWITGAAVTLTIATCPDAITGLVLPRHYTASAALLPPLALAGFAGATTALASVVFQTWGPARPTVMTLGLACLTGGTGYALTAARPLALAWCSAAVTCVVALVTVLRARRLVPGLGPAAGAAAPLAVAAMACCALFALRPYPALWALAALAVLAGAALAIRVRPRRPGPYRVLHLGFEDPRRPGAGGGSVRTHEVNRRLAARGVEVTVVVAPWPGATGTVRDGVRYVPLPARPGPLARSRFAAQIAYFAVVVTRLGRLTRRHDPDVVVEDFAAPFSSVCVPYLTRRPVVGLVQWLFAADKAREFHLPFGAVERRGLASHTTLLAVGDDLGEELRRRNPAARVEVIPNGVDRAAFVPPVARRGDHVLYLGRLETTSKGLDLLLRAYALAAPRTTADLHIAGDGPHAADARALAAELGIADRVRWLGRVDGPARFHLLASARLACVPSRQETFGMVAAEALATGTPVLAFDIPRLRDLVTDDVGVRVPPGDLDAYAAALVALTADPARCAELGAKGPPTVAHLDWDRIAAAQLAAYHRVTPGDRLPYEAPVADG
ncbi:glycosyltransferase [Streptomyces hesseae]|uniref:D-inositol 3-phosphate glycosyltransferase n=1 Tax=Streptomyces hesseae TaxID=3075519 RepID=A0ABU2SQC3_9ACTN|nr:glycosyltransferase [Streptomyces sp. DSM 40473]MDT0451075.1 glycosyltransferase [Streptomyces sp. DSM 40473]